MDTGAYPSDVVKKFLEPIVHMKVNTAAGKDGARLAKLFEVDAWPTLVMILPNGDVLKRIEGGLESPEQFTGGWTGDFWNEYAGAENAAPQDKKKIAENLFILVTWFPHSEYGQKAAESKKRYENDADFKARWEELAKETERKNLWAKADARMKLKKKKDEIVEPLKALVEMHAGSKEATDAAALLKKMGVKLEPPADAPK
ncbi:MAG: hypothetical protein HYY18_07765 [Planctomycetes bacterium]|nr:hypothetical protein [Planctomycetota bacterium]